jgi:Uma2 family endonuclease
MTKKRLRSKTCTVQAMHRSSWAPRRRPASASQLRDLELISTPPLRGQSETAEVLSGFDFAKLRGIAHRHGNGKRPKVVTQVLGTFCYRSHDVVCIQSTRT